MGLAIKHPATHLHLQKPPCPHNADNCPRTIRACAVFPQKARHHAVFPTSTPLASVLQHLVRKPQSSIERRTAMKFETLMLNSLFAACVAICVSTLVAMLA
jgi:hypothetical protein